MTDPVWQFEHAIECKASRSFVWSFWTDVSNWAKLEGDAVEWIQLNGAFEVGTIGSTKIPGQEAFSWEITKIDPEKTALIEIELEKAVFYNQMQFEAIATDYTRITQTLSVAGPNAQHFVSGMQTFEESAPQGLAKLGQAIARAFVEPN